MATHIVMQGEALHPAISPWPGVHLWQDGEGGLRVPPCWVLSPPDSSDSEVELSMVRHQPEGLEQLQAQTKFTKKELQSLYRGFKNVSDPTPQDRP